MHRELVSVIIPTHNSEKYIEAALKSVLEQSFSNLEIICVDSSSDNTTKIISKYANEDSRIKIITDENSSYGHKLNVGISNASGEYISILESDDEYDRNFIYKLINAMEVDLAFIRCSYAFLADTNKRRILLSQINSAPENQNRRIVLSKEGYIRQNIYNSIWTGLYRKSFLIDNNIILNESPGASYQDTGFSFLCALYAKTIKLIPDALYLYRVDNIKSSSKDDSKYMLIQTEFEWIKKEMIKRNLTSDTDKEFYLTAKLASYYWNAKRLHKYTRQKFLDEVCGKLCEEYEGTIFEEHEDKRLRYLQGVDASLMIQDLERLNQANMLVECLWNRKNVVLWGATAIGKFVLKVQSIIGVNSVEKIVDGNMKLIGTTIENYIIKSPQEIFDNQHDNSFILAGRKSTHEIKEKLLGLGIVENRIIEITQEIDSETLMLAIGKICK